VTWCYIQKLCIISVKEQETLRACHPTARIFAFELQVRGGWSMMVAIDAPSDVVLHTKAVNCHPTARVCVWLR
jgi:hypothetical protein